MSPGSDPVHSRPVTELSSPHAFHSEGYDSIISSKIHLKDRFEELYCVVPPVSFSHLQSFVDISSRSIAMHSTAVEQQCLQDFHMPFHCCSIEWIGARDDGTGVQQ